MTELPPPDLLVTLHDGRRLAVDDRGDPEGAPVLFLHGTPDTRLARHPDDDIARTLGIRLLAADRPGLGHSDVDADATPSSVADDLVAVLDHLGIGAVDVLAWSAGSIGALALAGRHPGRVTSVVLVAPLVPADAYDDPTVLEGADETRHLFAEHLGTTSPDDLGRELAVWLVPPELDEATARAMLADTLAAVVGIHDAGEQLVTALRASIVAGMTGVERDIAAQATPLGPLLDAIRAPVTIHVGSLDTVAPPAMARWLAARLDAALHVHDGSDHALAITSWSDLLAALAPA